LQFTSRSFPACHFDDIIRPQWLNPFFDLRQLALLMMYTRTGPVLSGIAVFRPEPPFQSRYLN
jgi:hypothetical protein